MLTQTLDNSDKEKKLKDREFNEMKNVDKIIKKEKNDFENVAGPGCSNAKFVFDKIMRTIQNTRKVSK